MKNLLILLAILLAFASAYAVPPSSTYGHDEAIFKVNIVNMPLNVITGETSGLDNLEVIAGSRLDFAPPLSIPFSIEGSPDAQVECSFGTIAPINGLELIGEWETMAGSPWSNVNVWTDSNGLLELQFAVTALDATNCQTIDSYDFTLTVTVSYVN